MQAFFIKFFCDFDSSELIVLSLHYICVLLILYFGVHVHKAFDIGQINKQKTIKQAEKLVCVPKQ